MDRFREHCRHTSAGKEAKLPFHVAINKYGADDFYLNILEDNIPNNMLGERESYWIAKMHTYVHDEQSNGYNLTLGGEVPPRQGKHTEEQKQKISKGLKKYYETHEAHKLTEEQRKKIAESQPDMSGANNPRARAVRCIETGELFSCAVEACNKYGMGKGNLWSALNHKGQNKCGGYHWAYVN